MTGMYAFRHDVGNFFYQAFGLEGHAWLLDTALKPTLPEEGEPFDEDVAKRLRTSNTLCLRLNGYGVRSLVDALRKDVDAKGDADDTARGIKSEKRQAAARRKKNPFALNADQQAEVEEDVKLQKLEAYELEAGKSLEVLSKKELRHRMNVQTILASKDVSEQLLQLAGLAAQARQEDTNVALNATMREVLSLLRKRGREEDGEEEEERAGKKVKKEVGNGKGKENEVDEVDEVEASEILAQLVANEIMALGGAGHERSEIEAALKSRIGHPIDLKNFLHRHPAVFSFTHGRPGLWTLRYADQAAGAVLHPPLVRHD
ncbi:unnamed protein product [Tilletia controversa]|nr:unnamed protein product [Tilletia controversa]